MSFLTLSSFIPRFEQQVESLRNQSFNMEQANYAAQTLKDTQNTVNAMKDGVKQMKNEFKKINIENIEVIGAIGPLFRA